MPKKYLCLFFLLTALAGKAQVSSWFTINQAYKAGTELFEKGKFAAASGQFSLVERWDPGSAGVGTSPVAFSLLKENATFYRAVCALNLGNDDAESLFLSYIREYPVSANTRLAYYQVGRFYFRKKLFQKSIEWLKKINPKDLTASESSEYRFDMGYSYFTLKEYAQAEPYFAGLKNEKNEFTEASIYYYAFIHYTDADYKTALTEFERLKGSGTYEKSYPYFISALYFLDKRYDDVIRFAVPALQTIDDQYKAEVYRIVGASYFAKQDYKNAGANYQKFQDRDLGKTQNNQDSYEIGYTFYKLANYTRAITELEKMSTTDDFYQYGMITLGDAYLKTNNKQGARNSFFKASKLTFNPSLQEEGLFNYAKLSYELEFHAVSLDAVQQFMKTYPNSAKTNEAKTLLAQVLLSTKNYREAINVLESIANRNQDARIAYQKVTYYRALEFYNERAFENSISMFMRSIANSTDKEIEALATYWLGEALFEVKKYKESVTQFDKFLVMPAAKQTDVYSYANYALGYSAFLAESYSKAATYFERFLKTNEQDNNTINDATFRLADSYFANRQFDRALTEYNKVISRGVKGQDYALFQRGIIQGLQEMSDVKITTLQSLLDQYPNSNYADDAVFEIADTYFKTKAYDPAKSGFTTLIEKYPRSSYVPRALLTIGLVQYNQNDDTGALATYDRVVKEYSTTDEAKLALDAIKNIYLDKGDSNGFLVYANGTNIGNLTTADQDAITFEAAKNLFLHGNYQGTYDAINAYFDKFPKAIYDKNAKFIRAESLVKLGRPDEAVTDYNYILNDWTSDFTERSLISIVNLYLKQKKYNEAVVYLKKLELTAEYKSNYGFAINTLIDAYANMNMPDDVLKYAAIIDKYEKSSQDDKARGMLYAGKAYLMKQDTAVALRQFSTVIEQSQSIAAAEAKYTVATIQFQRGDYKATQKSIDEIRTKFTSYDYWQVKTLILWADLYAAQKQPANAIDVLQSIIDGYKGDDDVLPTAKAKLDALKKKK